MTKLINAEKIFLEQKFNDLELAKHKFLQKEFDNCVFISCNFTEALC